MRSHPSPPTCTLLTHSSPLSRGHSNKQPKIRNPHLVYHRRKLNPQHLPQPTPSVLQCVNCSNNSATTHAFNSMRCTLQIMNKAIVEGLMYYKKRKSYEDTTTTRQKYGITICYKLGHLQPYDRFLSISLHPHPTHFPC